LPAQRQDLVIDRSRREGQGLPNIFLFEFCVFTLALRTLRIGNECLKDWAGAEKEAADARFAIRTISGRVSPSWFGLLVAISGRLVNTPAV
jgi:hypothetical protein